MATVRGADRLLLLTASPGETRLALIEGGVVVEVHHRRDHECQSGDLYRARVGGRVPGIAAVFVDVGLGRDGFLAAEDGPDPLPPEGTALIVEVLQPPRSGKGAKVTAKPSLAGAFVVYTPARAGVAVSSKLAHKAERRRLTEWAASVIGPEEGLVVRTAAFEQPEATLSQDFIALRTAWVEITRHPVGLPGLLRRGQSVLSLGLAGGGAERILCDSESLAAGCRTDRPDLAEVVRVASGSGDLFAEEGVDDAIDAALVERVVLPEGGVVTIQETAALVAIDIDSGRVAATVANRAAVAVIAHQIRLRNLAGQIVIDIADPAHGVATEQRVFAEALGRAVARDPIPTRLMGISPSGLIELRRERRGPTLASRFLAARPEAPAHAEAVALAALRHAERAARAQPGLRVGLIVHPLVGAALSGPLCAATAAMEARLGHRVRLDTPPRLAVSSITVFDAREKSS